jgi:hypothetical protein
MKPTRKARSHDDYTIGWISALPLEISAEADIRLGDIVVSMPNGYTWRSDTI